MSLYDTLHPTQCNKGCLHDVPIWSMCMSTQNPFLSMGMHHHQFLLWIPPNLSVLHLPLQDPIFLQVMLLLFLHCAVNLAIDKIQDHLPMDSGHALPLMRGLWNVFPLTIKSDSGNKGDEILFEYGDTLSLIPFYAGSLPISAFFIYIARSHVFSGNALAPPPLCDQFGFAYNFFTMVEYMSRCKWQCTGIHLCISNSYPHNTCNHHSSLHRLCFLWMDSLCLLLCLRPPTVRMRWEPCPTHTLDTDLSKDFPAPADNLTTHIMIASASSLLATLLLKSNVDLPENRDFAYWCCCINCVLIVILVPITVTGRVMRSFVKERDIRESHSWLAAQAMSFRTWHDTPVFL